MFRNFRSFRPQRTFFTVIDETHRGIRLTLGKMTPTSNVGPGIRLYLPLIHDIYQFDMREQVVNLRSQECITSDNLTIHADVVFRYKVEEPRTVFLSLKNPDNVMATFVQTKVRDCISSMPMDSVLRDREKLSTLAMEDIRAKAATWGINFTSLNLSEIKFSEEMVRALGKVVEEKRNAESKLISAKADIEIAQMFKQASDIYGENQVTLRLRELHALQSIAKEKNMIVVIPDLLFNGKTQSNQSNI